MIQPEHGFHNNNINNFCGASPHFCASRSVWQWEGIALRRHSSNSSRGWQKQMGGAGWANWATALNHEAWDDVVPSQSSVVSQLTSRGTWRHLVPVWMTVTVEGRGRGGSATTCASSRTGEGSSEFWYTLTAEGKGAIGGPEGQNTASARRYRSTTSSDKQNAYRLKDLEMVWEHLNHW